MLMVLPIDTSVGMCLSRLQPSSRSDPSTLSERGTERRPLQPVRLIDPATPPKVTDVAPARFVPVIVTVSPPAAVPKLGLMLVMVGARGSTMRSTRPQL